MAATGTRRIPYVDDPDPAAAARRSAQIDREEADTLAADDPRREALLTSAELWEEQALTAAAEQVRFTHADLDRIQATVEELAADPALDGYVVGYPTWGLISGHDIDINIAATSSCPKCGRDGRGHAGFVAADGSHSWRGFAICPSCGTAEEF